MTEKCEFRHPHVNERCRLMNIDYPDKCIGEDNCPIFQTYLTMKKIYKFMSDFSIGMSLGVEAYLRHSKTSPK